MIDQLINDIDTYLSYSNLLDGNQKVIFLSESRSNINFLIDAGVEKYIFKLNKISQLGLKNQIRYEYDALKILEKSYVTPRIFFLDDSTTFFDYGALIMQYIDGRKLDYEEDLHESAKTFGKIHSLNLGKIDTSSFIVQDNIIDTCLEKIKSNLEEFFKSPDISVGLKISMNNYLEWADKNKDCQKFFEKDKWQVINNTEPHANNFIIGATNKRAYLIDWEKPVITDPSIDLAFFLSNVTTSWTSDFIFTEDQKDDFFKTYLMYIDTSDRDIMERVKIYTPYLNLRVLSGLFHKLLQYEKDKDNIKNINTYKRLKEFLNIDYIKSEVSQLR